MKRVKKCANGHIYPSSLDECPFCAQPPIEDFSTGIPDDSECPPTQMLGIDDGQPHTIAVADARNIPAAPDQNPRPDNPYTYILQDARHPAGDTPDDLRPASRLVGWVATYAIDPQGLSFVIREGRNYIGRAPGCAVCLNDPTVSDRHAVILYRAGVFRVQDMMSSNGTYVNEEYIDDSPYELHDGDYIRVGRVTLRLRTVR